MDHPPASATSIFGFAHDDLEGVRLAVEHALNVGLEAHDNSVARIFPRLGETGSTKEIVDLLDRA